MEPVFTQSSTARRKRRHQTDFHGPQTPGLTTSRRFDEIEERGVGWKVHAPTIIHGRSSLTEANKGGGYVDTESHNLGTRRTRRSGAHYMFWAREFAVGEAARKAMNAGDCSLMARNASNCFRICSCTSGINAGAITFMLGSILPRAR